MYTFNNIVYVCVWWGGGGGGGIVCILSLMRQKATNGAKNLDVRLRYHWKGVPL